MKLLKPNQYEPEKWEIYHDKIKTKMQLIQYTSVYITKHEALQNYPYGRKVKKIFYESDVPTRIGDKLDILHKELYRSKIAKYTAKTTESIMLVAKNDDDTDQAYINTDRRWDREIEEELPISTHCNPYEELFGDIKAENAMEYDKYIAYLKKK